MYKNLIVCIVFPFLFMGCGERSVKFPETRNQEPDIQLNTLNLIPVQCSPVDASYVGTLHWVNDYLYYIDEKFCALFVLTVKGILLTGILRRDPVLTNWLLKT